jgi:acid ceramidase
VIPEIDVDLRLPPERRWEALAGYKNGARALLRFYVRDIGGLGPFAPILTAYRDAFVDPEYVDEMRGIASVLDAPEEEVVLANLYYDAMKLVLSSNTIGCTGFVLDTPSGPLHARNLDWTTAENLLASETIVENFHRGGGQPLYRTVGWPGFIGCFSGVAPGRFCVTLNAVLSDDPPELAAPISFVLRRALETASSFESAVALLRDTPIASDALLLVSGTRRGEMVVVERSPKRSAVRGAQDGLVVATNDYRALGSTSGSRGEERGELAATSCARYDRAAMLARTTAPSVDGCLDILRDPKVMMGGTVQHIVLRAATGDLRVTLPVR